MTGHFTDVCVSTTTTVLEAIRAIESSSLQIALVVDESRRLLGTVTDGDVRRGILDGVGVDAPVESIMNRNPTTCSVHATKSELLDQMRHRHIAHLPRVDSTGVLVGLETLADLVEQTALENWVVIMAGGRGQRLRPLTATTPKPMLPLGGRPLLEIIISSLVGQGFGRMFLSVNYMSEVLREHFGDGERFGARIDYLHEDEALGTAGGLTLLDERPKAPLVVMNGDLLTSIDFRHLLTFHREHRNVATMCVREYSVEVPYGVVEIEGQEFLGIVEKPTRQYFVNGGIYVLQPETLDLLPKGEPYDMPDLFEALRRDERTVGVFPVREYWLDIGRVEDFQRAESEVTDLFPS